MVELENILANQEALDKQISKVLIKEDDKALFTKKRVLRENMTTVKSSSENKTLSRRQQGWQRGQRKKGWGPQQGGARQPQYRYDKKEKKYHWQDDQCYKCGRKGHFAWDCQAKNVKGNAATLQKSESEEERDL